MSIEKTLTLFISDHLGGLGACPVRSIILILLREPVNRGPSSIVGADHARWHTPRAHRLSTMDSRRDLKVASRTSWTTLLALQVSAEQSIDCTTATQSSPPIRPIQIGPQGGGQNFDRRLLSTILDSGARPNMPGKRATSRVERVIILLAALVVAPSGCRRACG